MNKLSATFLLASILWTVSLPAQNPISPMGVYIADPTARVGADGRMYIYGSLDVSPDYYCSPDYHVLSSANLKTWTLHPYSFRNDETLYAPDLMERDGTYFLYYDTPDGSEYVAVSDCPTGPFHDGVKIEGPRQIDPNIFIDDDGQAYYFWGQFSAKGAKMNPDLKTLDWSTMVDGIVTEKDHFFHEGSYVIKRGPYYYYTYADISRNGRPTSIGYAMATSPLGPYTYKGVIIDNAGCDPETWNNHGSLVELNGQWYILYHRSTHASRMMRKACIEPIHFNDDGTIDEVEMTSQGAGGPLDAFSYLDAARACRLRGNVRISQMEGCPDREILDGIRFGDAAVWKYLDFGSGAKAVQIRILAPSGGRILLKTDSPDSRPVKKMDIPAGERWQTVKVNLNKVKGVHALWMEFEGDFCIDWFRFFEKAGNGFSLDAREAGAVGDGVTLNTDVLQAAIDQIGAKGGGTLFISDGNFLTGNLFLRDHVELRVEAGASLLGSTDPGDYTPVEDIGMPEGRGKDSSRMGLIVVHKVHDVSLGGFGTIDGQGLALALHVDSLNIRNIAPNPMEKRRRPGEQQRQKLIFCSDAEDITIEDLHLRNSSVWGVSFDSCTNIRIEGVRIHNRAYWNNDGIDLADCAHVVIRGCDIDSADDGICFKSYRDDFVNEDVLVEDCRIASSANAVKFGTASFGSWRNVTIRRIDIRDTFRSCIAVESVDGARIQDILVEDIMARNTGNPIFIRLGKRHCEAPGSLKGVTIRNLRCEVPFGIPDLDYDVRGPVDDSMHNPYPCSITGLPGHPVEDILIENVDLVFPGRASKAMGYIPLSRLDLVPERERNYPEFDMFGELPAWAFYLRHVRGIRFRDVRLRLQAGDYRPAFVQDDVEGAVFERITCLDDEH